jgi:hypothetical protein
MIATTTTHYLAYLLLLLLLAIAVYETITGKVKPRK